MMSNVRPDQLKAVTGSSRFARSCSANIGEKTMALKCNTTDGRLWESKINKVPEGNISIEEENDKGDFEGDHIGVRERIKGNCNDKRMWFLLSAGEPRYFYIGERIGDDKVRGTRTTLGTTTVSEVEAAGVEDEWVATRPPTRLASSDEATSSKQELSETGTTQS
jgi:hypothetical protein